MFSISTNDLYPIRDFREAEHIYNNTKPIRGRSEDTRPLGKRSKTHMCITSGTDDGKKYYAVKLYATECVKWYEDGTVHINHGGWVTNSTTAFIHAVIGRTNPFYCFSHKGNMWIAATTRTEPPTTHSIPVPKSGLYFNAQRECLNTPQCYTLRHDKEAAKSIRKLPAIKAFIKYAKAMNKLGVGVKWQNYEQRRATQSALKTIMEAPHKEPPLELMAEYVKNAKPLTLTTIYKAYPRSANADTNNPPINLYKKVPWDTTDKVPSKRVYIL